MSREGLLTILFEPEIEVIDELPKVLKEDNLLSLKLIPNQEAIGWLDEHFFDFEWEIASVGEDEMKI